MLSKNNIHQQLNFYLTMVLLFSLPLHLGVASVATVFLFLNWLVEARFIQKFKNAFNVSKSKSIAFLLLLFFYALYFIAIPNTSDHQGAMFELEQNLSFFIYPLIVFASVSYQFKKRQQRYLLYSFLSGLVVSSLYCFGQSLVGYLDTGDLANFYYGAFSVIIPPTYFALILITAILQISCILIKRWNSLFVKEKVALILLVLFYIVIIALTNSRAGMISLVLLAVIFVSYGIIAYKRYILGLIFIVGFIAGFFLIKKIMPQTFERFAMVKEVLKAKKLSDIEHWNGTTLRLQIYYSSIELIKESPWVGVGPGDTHDVLLENYRKNGFRHAVYREYNAHNQYLQVLLGFGLLGFIPFFVLHIIALRVSIKRKDLVFFSFLVLLMFLYFFESLLERQAGVMFVVFGFSFLFLRPYLFNEENSG